jgi:hypothetical protein
MPETPDEDVQPDELCDLGPNPEDCAGEPVDDPWNLPDEPLSEVLAAINTATERGVTARPEGSN